MGGGPDLTGPGDAPTGLFIEKLRNNSTRPSAKSAFPRSSCTCFVQVKLNPSGAGALVSRVAKFVRFQSPARIEFGLPGSAVKPVKYLTLASLSVVKLVA